MKLLNDKNNPLTLIAMGGLANRMRAIVSGYALACDAGVPMQVVWYPLPELGACFEDLFCVENLPFAIVPCSACDYWLKFSDPRKKNLYLSGVYQKLHSSLHLTDAGLREIGSDAALRELVAGAHNPMISSGQAFYPASDSFYRTFFKPCESVRCLIDDIVGKFGSNMTGIHIRRTDNEQSIMHSPLELFESKIEEIISREPNAMFYIASDDVATKRLLSEKFGQRIVTTEVRLGRDDNMAVRQAVAEMFALAATRQIIGSYYSSFSEVAAKIGNINIEQLYR